MQRLAKGCYICSKCRQRFNWGFGFTGKPPEVKDEERIEAVCLECQGVEFKSPLEILTGKKVH